MRARMLLRAVIYDLDGTLIDSRADLAASVNGMLRRMALPEHEQRIIESFIGEGAERLIRRSLGAHEDRYAEAAPLWREEYGARLLDQTRPYAGIEDALALPPAARAVLTNKPGGFARRILEGLGLARSFAQVIGGDEAPRKPSPDGLLRLCAALGAPPAECLLVGDSTVDLATARAASVPFCAVLWGLGERASLATADYLCREPADLVRLLRSFETP